MATTPSGIHVVDDVKKETEPEKVEGIGDVKVPDWVEELAKTDFTNEQIWRFNLISNLVGIRMALEDLVDEFRKAPTQRVMNIQMTPQQQLQMNEQLARLAGVKLPGGGS